MLARSLVYLFTFRFSEFRLALQSLRVVRRRLFAQSTVVDHDGDAFLQGVVVSHLIAARIALMRSDAFARRVSRSSLESNFDCSRIGCTR